MRKPSISLCTGLLGLICSGLLGFSLGGGALGFVPSAEAHHSFLREYDPESIITIRGTVTEVWYQNPHSRVYLEDAESVLWETETYPRNILDRRGWKYDDLKVGDQVVVTGRRARDGSPRVQMLTIVRPSDGWEGIGFETDSID